MSGRQAPQRPIQMREQYREAQMSSRKRNKPSDESLCQKMPRRQAPQRAIQMR